jgi:hypothetical protein
VATLAGSRLLLLLLLLLAIMHQPVLIQRTGCSSLFPTLFLVRFAVIITVTHLISLPLSAMDL